MTDFSTCLRRTGVALLAGAAVLAAGAAPAQVSSRRGAWHGAWQPPAWQGNEASGEVASGRPDCPDPGSWTSVDSPRRSSGPIVAQGWSPCADLPGRGPRPQLNIEVMIDPNGAQQSSSTTQGTGEAGGTTGTAGSGAGQALAGPGHAGGGTGQGGVAPWRLRRGGGFPPGAGQGSSSVSQYR